MPSCVLTTKDHKHELDLIVVAPGEDYSNCTNILKPISARVQNRQFLAYPYVEEVTRKSFLTNTQLVEIKENTFFACRESDTISSWIGQRQLTQALLKTAIHRFGCTLD